MAGLLAWAADVVRTGGAQNIDEDDPNSIPVIFTEEQRKYVGELDRKAASLSRSIQDLRLRLPPPDISQRLPHLHAHSLASNAALALQLNSHLATREQVQLREVTLQEENAAYEKAISNCQNKIQEKMQEAILLQRKLEEMDATVQDLRSELESTEAALVADHSGRFRDAVAQSKTEVNDGGDSESNAAILEKLDSKKKELSSTEEVVQDLEKRWAQVQEKALKLPTPAQREKILDKQLHSLIEQLAAKQAQAESLFSEVHLKEMELERLNGLWRVESSNLEVNTARNRFGRSISERGSASSDYVVDVDLKPPYPGGRSEIQQKLMLLRSSFVLYIFALHILVFIKISF